MPNDKSVNIAAGAFAINTKQIKQKPLTELEQFVEETISQPKRDTTPHGMAAKLHVYGLVLKKIEKRGALIAQREKQRQKKSQEQISNNTIAPNKRGGKMTELEKITKSLAHFLNQYETNNNEKNGNNNNENTNENNNYLDTFNRILEENNIGPLVLGKFTIYLPLLSSTSL